MTSRLRTTAPRLVLVITVCAGFASACQSSDPSVDAAAAGAPVADTPEVAVVTQPVLEREVPTIVRATGTFIADESSDVTPQVSGQVIATPVNVGDIVSTGQLLVRLDDRDARLTLRQAEAALQQAEAQAGRARAEVTRNTDLVQSGDISRSSFEQLTTQVAVAEAAVAQAAAQVASAQKALDDTAILAPFSGHVSAREVAVGEFVNTSATVTTIVRITPIKLGLRVPESSAARLRRGMPVVATVPAHPGATFTGEVSALNVALDPASRSMTIEARFANADRRLMPGMFGSAEVELPATERAVFVPAAAIVSMANGEAAGVFVVEGGIARVRVVQAGEPLGDGLVQVLAGLAPGTLVATTNVEELIDGSRVRVEQAAVAADPQ